MINKWKQESKLMTAEGERKKQSSIENFASKLELYYHGKILVKCLAI